MIKYFAYGSNMNLKRMGERKIRFSQRNHATLSGWRLEFNKMASRNSQEGYANIVPDENETVEGILYEIEDSDISILDQYEGYPDHYGRSSVKVQLDETQKVESIAYIANPDKIKIGLKPTKEYLSHLLKGCDLLPELYCKRLMEVETLD
jgi:gamma-glutamylcyclotransferase (GGCT)/AIG2-like uncharacterized protein YtfP